VSAGASSSSGPKGHGTPQGAAFFDFDHTLLDGDASVVFGWTLAEWGYAKGDHLTGKERRRHVLATTAHVAATVGKGAVYRSLNAVGLLKRSKLLELTYAFLRDLPAEEMSARMERVWNERLEKRLYPEMRRVLADHRAAGRRIVIVTTGLRELVEHSKKALGDGIEVIGVEMHTKGGMWLGRVEGPLYGVQKAAAVRAWAAERGIDLAQSYAYSDHYSDAAFLALVGHPVCVNPTMRLRVHARKMGWPTMHVMPAETER
jgi:HAD superfamily hydrolase (TIGR01490 family)